MLSSRSKTPHLSIDVPRPLKELLGKLLMVQTVTSQLILVEGKRETDRQRNKWSFLVKTILVLFLENTVREVEG